MGSRTPEIQHHPVLLEETLAFLEPARNGIVVDCTLGFGGHSLAVLEAFPKAQVVAIDQDEVAIAASRRRLSEFDLRIDIVHSNFSRIKKVLNGRNIDKVHGIIADLGVSSMQVDSETRGFSFRFDAPLDMRMDETADIPTAAELLGS